MKKLIVILILFFSINSLYSQSLNSKNGYGIQVGDPTAITGKFWLDNTDAIQASLGGGTFAGFRVTVDYVRHFNTFNSNMFFLYGGLGGVVGSGEGYGVWHGRDDDDWYYRDSGFGLGGRGLVGLQFLPKNTSLEFFLEVGVLIGLAPEFGALSESAAGVRFYF